MRPARGASWRPARLFLTAAHSLLAVSALGDGSWIPLRPLPAPRQEVGVAELDGRIYVVAGFNGAGQSVNTVERYDPGADQWQAVAPLPAPAPLNHVGAAAVGGHVYAVGGLRQNFSAVDTLYRYDPAVNQWSARATMPTARGASGIAVLDGRIYAAGGSPSARSRDFAVYDPATNQWTTLPLMPTGRDHLAAAAFDGRIYAISGRTPILQGAVESFDPATGQWTPRAPIPTPRAGIAAALVDGFIYVFGGEGNPAHPLGIFDDVEAYDPVADRWTALSPMPVPRHGIGAASLAGRIYLPGGATVQGFGASAHHDAFRPCYPDCNHDGVLNLADFGCFQTRFALSDPYADCNRDGVLNLADFGCFQTRFGLACP